MNTAIEQIRPETISLIAAQAESLGLSIDEYLRQLLPAGEMELGLDSDTRNANQSRSDSEREEDRQRSIAWIRSHRKEYGGLYVALVGNELIGTGKRYGDVLKIARQKGYDDAFIGDVLPLDYEGSLGGWD